MLDLVIEQGQHELELRRSDDGGIFNNVDHAVSEVLGVLHVIFEDSIFDDFLY